MILIADSGSTKTTWCYISSENKNELFLTGGINPYFRTTGDIVAELKTELVPNINGPVEKIYFYGAGIVNDEIGLMVKNALVILFPEAKYEIQSDLLAAARSTLQNKKGIACILGTGSNSCLYDGEKIIQHVPPLGFILGDEGSGSMLGRKLLADYLKGIMPKILSEKFSKRFSFQYAEYLQKVYKEERANKFLASLVPFIYENLQNEYCEKLVKESLREFLTRNVFRYPDFRNQSICFVGSIGFYFSDILITVLKNEDLVPEIIIQEPIEGLIKYHTRRLTETK